MLHSIKISKGNKATLCSRYVQTYKYTIEKALGYSVFPSIFSSFNGISSSIARCVLTFARVITGKFNPVSHGFGAANTSLSLIGGRLYALCESDLPYAIKLTSEGDIITLGRHDFYAGHDAPFSRMTAHPKTDPETGEAFAFMYDFSPPFLKYFRIDPNGKKQPDVPIFSMKGVTVIHDFAITKNYAILPDIQIGLGPMEILKGRSPVIVDPAKVPRLGIIPRYAVDESEMWWIDVPGFNMLHSVNAWEEDKGDTIVMVASNMLSVKECLESMDMKHLSLEKITINVKEKTVTRIPVSTIGHDFGAINPAYLGKKNRYLYAASLLESNVGGVVKIDLSLVDHGGDDGTVARRLCGRGFYCGEPVFVPREPNNNMTADNEEDDGYLLTFVYDENAKESKFLVMDAKSPTLQIVAAVKLPRRVPCGFHGLFVPQTHLNKL